MIKNAIALIAIGVIIFLSSVCILEHNARVRQSERLNNAITKYEKLSSKYNNLKESFNNLKATRIAQSEGATIIATCAKSGTIARKLNNLLRDKDSYSKDELKEAKELAEKILVIEVN